MHIHILEDIKEQRKYIEEVIKKEIAEKKYNMKIGIVERDPYVFIERINMIKDNEGSIYFLDIDLKKEITGLDVAKKIREMDSGHALKSYIVFITQYSEMMPITFKYKLETFDFIPKGHITKEIGTCLEEVNKKYIDEKKKPLGSLSIDMLLAIKIEDIITITICKKNIIVISTKNRILHTRKSIKEIELKLNGYNFIKPNQSCLVNYSHIDKIDLEGKKLILDNGTQCKISNRKLKEFS